MMQSSAASHLSWGYKPDGIVVASPRLRLTVSPFRRADHTLSWPPTRRPTPASSSRTRPCTVRALEGRPRGISAPLCGSVGNPWHLFVAAGSTLGTLCVTVRSTAHHAVHWCRCWMAVLRAVLCCVWAPTIYPCGTAGATGPGLSDREVPQPGRGREIGSPQSRGFVCDKSAFFGEV